MQTVIDLLLFIFVCKWIHDFYEHMHFNPDNKFMLTGDAGTEGNMMLNMMWEIHCTSTKRQPECIEMSGAY